MHFFFVAHIENIQIPTTTKEINASIPYKNKKEIAKEK